MPRLKNSKHETFCQEYMIDLNGARAYRRTYGKVKGARVSASKLLSKANVAGRIVELKARRSKKLEITQDMVLRELAILAFSDFRDYGQIINEYITANKVKHLSPEGRLKLKMFKNMKKGATKAIKSISESITKDGIQIKFKLHGKEKPLELLGKHVDLFKEKSELSDLVQYLVSDKFLPKVKNSKKQADARQ